MGTLLDKIKKDAAKIITDKKGFAVPIKITTPDKTTTVEFSGLFTEHYSGVGDDGRRVSSQNAHLSFPEKALTDQGYVTRNSKGDVDLKQHVFEVTIDSETIKTYWAASYHPDNTLGLILCILSSYVQN